MLFLLLIELFKCEEYVLISAYSHNFTLIEYFLDIILSIFGQLSLYCLCKRGFLSKQTPHLECILLVILDNCSLLKDFKLQKSLCLLLDWFESFTLFRSQLFQSNRPLRRLHKWNIAILNYLFLRGPRFSCKFYTESVLLILYHFFNFE